MELKLNRIFLGNDYTIGELYVNEEYICDTLEDKVRELPAICPYTPKYQNCKCKEKVYSETAIPAGTYKVKLTYSNKYKKVMPEICDVPHFLGIRIHSLNTSKETEGCIGVGNWDEKKGNWISNSRVNYNKLYDLLKSASDSKEDINITINNQWK